MEHVLTRETPINHRVHRNKESVAKEGTVIDRCKKKKKKKKRILFVRNSHQFHPTAIFPAREHFPSPPRPFFRESREQSRSHTSPIPSPPPPLEARPRPTSAVEHRPLLVLPFPFARRGGARARGNGARRRRRAGGVAPTSSANRPTDRPDRAFSSQPGQYQAGSRREGCSNPSIRNRRPRSSSPSPPCTTRIERNVQQHLARGCRR